MHNRCAQAALAKCIRGTGSRGKPRGGDPPDLARSLLYFQGIRTSFANGGETVLWIKASIRMRRHVGRTPFFILFFQEASDEPLLFSASRRKWLLAAAAGGAYLLPGLRNAVWAAGSDAPEKASLRVGFIPLTDCAPVVMARCCPASGQPALKQTAVRIQPLRTGWLGWLWQRNIEAPFGLRYWARAQRPTLDHAQIAARRRRRTLCAAGGRRAQDNDAGRIICSCFGVGETAIRQAIAQCCDSSAALGNALKCGTRCGSCIPELKQPLLMPATA